MIGPGKVSAPEEVQPPGKVGFLQPGEVSPDQDSTRGICRCYAGTFGWDVHCGVALKPPKMGVLGRVFSTRNKRSKAAFEPSRPALKSTHFQRFQEDEETATRLLRSSSSRFAIISELDYTSLPPIRKSISGSSSQRLFHFF
jgi:hypothetical protein